MKYVAPVAELVSLETVSVLLASQPEETTTSCGCDGYVNSCTLEGEAGPIS